MLTIVRRDRPWRWAVPVSYLALALACPLILPTLYAPMMAGLIGGAALTWLLGRWSIWWIDPGDINGEAVDPDSEIVVFHKATGSEVWFHGCQIRCDPDPPEAMAYAHRLSAAVERPVRVFATMREYVDYAADACRERFLQRLSPEELANVLPCAPRRKISLDRTTCFIADQTLTLTGRGVRFDNVEFPYDRILDVLVLPFDGVAVIVFLTTDTLYELRVGLPRDVQSERYQQTIGEARWIADQVRARLDAQHAAEIPAALTKLRQQSA